MVFSEIQWKYVQCKVFMFSTSSSPLILPTVSWMWFGFLRPPTPFVVGVRVVFLSKIRGDRCVIIIISVTFLQSIPKPHDDVFSRVLAVASWVSVEWRVNTWIVQQPAGSGIHERHNCCQLRHSKGRQQRQRGGDWQQNGRDTSWKMSSSAHLFTWDMHFREPVQSVGVHTTLGYVPFYRNTKRIHSGDHCYIDCCQSVGLCHCFNPEPESGCCVWVELHFDICILSLQ